MSAPRKKAGKSKGNRVENATARRLIASFGPAILIQQQHPLPRAASERLSMRFAVEAEYEARFNDGEPTHADAVLVAPAWSPAKMKPAGRIAIVSPAPAYEDAKRGELGWSRGARMLSQTLRKLGVDGDAVTWISIVPWWQPVSGDGGRAKTNHVPTAQELSDSQRGLMEAVDAADVDHVLLHGASALHAWRRDLTLERTMGMPGLWRQRWHVTPIWHVDAVMGQRAEHKFDEKPWRDAIEKFTTRVLEPIADGVVGGGLSTKCVAREGVDGARICNVEMFGWDEDGVPWCDRHFDGGRHGHTTTTKHYATTRDTRQGALL